MDKIAAQLFGIMAHSPLSIEETLIKLKEIGFDQIEPCPAFATEHALHKVLETAKFTDTMFEDLRQELKVLRI